MKDLLIPRDADRHELLGYWEVPDDRKRRVRQIYDSWTGWPSMDETAAVWQAAAEDTGRQNAPDAFLSDTPLLQLETTGRDRELVRDFREFVTGFLESRAGDRLHLYRYIDPSLAESLRDGKGVEFRTLSAWTSDPSAVMTFAQSIHGQDGGAVVAANVPVEWVWAAWPLVPDMSREQAEVVVAVPPGPTYQDVPLVDLQSFSRAQGLNADHWVPDL